MKDVLIPYALVNGKIKHLREITHRDEAFCIECKEQLILRDGEVNVKHLAHKPSSSCVYREYANIAKYSIESYEHKYAKEYLKDNLIYFRAFKDKIIAKGGEFKLGGYSDLRIESIELECRSLQKELNLKQGYIPDLLIRTTDKRLIALEIYKSNRKDRGKLREVLYGADISVYEIDINDISKVSIKGLFSKMELIYSKLKVEYDESLSAIHSTISRITNENECYKRNIEYLENKNEVLEMEVDSLNIKVNNFEKKIKFQERRIIELIRSHHKENEVSEDLIRDLRKEIMNLKEGYNISSLEKEVMAFKDKIDKLSKEKLELKKIIKIEQEKFNMRLKQMTDKYEEVSKELAKAEHQDVLWRLEMQKDRIRLLLEKIDELKSEIKKLKSESNI